MPGKTAVSTKPNDEDTIPPMPPRHPILRRQLAHLRPDDKSKDDDTQIVKIPPIKQP